MSCGVACARVHATPPVLGLQRSQTSASPLCPAARSYTTDSLFVIETTLGIYNHSLYDAITHECALIWQRVLVSAL